MKRGLPSVIAIAILVAIAFGGFEPFYLRIFSIDRARLAATLEELPYRKLPGLRDFFQQVRARTKTGDSIAVSAPGLHPTPSGEGAYEYFCARSYYILSGRRIVPVLAPGDEPPPVDAAKIDYAAVYHSSAAIPGFVQVWRGNEGALFRAVH